MAPERRLRTTRMIGIISVMLLVSTKKEGNMKYTYYKMIVVFCVVVLTGISGADLFAAQAPPPGDSQPIQAPQWPDVSIGGCSRYIAGKTFEPYEANDQVYFNCDIYVCGCVQTLSFSNKIEMDNILLEEIEAPIFTINKPPDCSPDRCTFVGISTSKFWKATLGNHTFKLTMDSKNDISEGTQNELNNTFSKTINVSIPRIDIKPPVEKDIKPVIPKAR